MIVGVDNASATCVEQQLGARHARERGDVARIDRPHVAALQQRILLGVYGAALVVTDATRQLRANAGIRIARRIKRIRLVTVRHT